MKTYKLRKDNAYTVGISLFWVWIYDKDAFDSEAPGSYPYGLLPRLQVPPTGTVFQLS